MRLSVLENKYGKKISKENACLCGACKLDCSSWVESDWDDLTSAASTTGGTITVDSNLTVTSPMTDYQSGTVINGQGNSIDGNQLQILNNAGQSGTTLTIINATITNSNGNAYGGGALNNENGNTLIIGETNGSNVVFQGNNAPGAYVGSAIRNSNATLEINNNVEFNDNYSAALGNIEGGGYNADGSNAATLEIGNNAQFTDNVSGGEGGAIYSQRFNETQTNIVNIGEGATFSGNNANGGVGGAVASYSSTLDVGAGATFENNTSTSDGGAIYNAAGKLTFDTSETTLSDGSTVKDIKFIGNTATTAGADLFQADSAQTEIKGGEGTELLMTGGIAGAGSILKSGENTFI